MNKRKARSGYEHNHTHNPRARESDERKLEMLRGMEIKRFQGYVDKQTSLMRYYIPEEKKKKVKIDPKFDLKGAARPAREFYVPAGMDDEPEAVDLFELHANRLWDIEQGRKLLPDMLSLGIAMHNLQSRTNDAIKVFNRIIELDPEDRQGARFHLLRCYLDKGAADRARNLLDQYPEDKSCCFEYSRALVEFISVMIGEEGSSTSQRDDALRNAVSSNKFAIWTIAHHSHFADSIQYTEKLKFPFPQGGIEDAINFFDVDVPLWIETDGVVDWVRGFIASERVAAPSAPPLILQPSASEEAAPASDSKMFEGMFFTALEMATESVSWHAAPLRTSKR